MAEDYIEQLFNAAIKSNADITICDLFESQNGVNTEIIRIGTNLQTWDIDEIKRKSLLYGTSVWQCLYKRELFFDNDLFFPENLFFEDNAIMGALVASAKKIAKVDKSLYYYRRDNASTTRSINNYRYFDRLVTAVMFLNHFKRLGLYEKFKPEVDWAFTKLYYINTIGGCLQNFEPIEFNKLMEVRREFPKYMPDYTSNRYYNSETTRNQRVFLSLVRCMPRLACLLWKIRIKLS